MPVVTDLGATFYEGADGAKVFTYTGRGTAGAKIEFKRGTSGWVDAGTTAANGAFSFETGWTATADEPIQIRQSIGTQISAPADAPVPVDAQAPGVTVTKATKYVDASGTTIYRFEGTRLPGATVKYTTSTGWYDGAKTFPSDTTFTLETDAVPADVFKFQQTFRGIASAETVVKVSDVVAEVPKVVVTKSSTYTNAAGETVHRFEGTRVAGSTVKYSVGNGWWNGSQSFPSATTFVLETTAGNDGTYSLRQSTGGADSAPTVITAADIPAELPAVSVSKSTSHTNAAGQTVYRYEGTGVAGATVQYGPTSAAWSNGMTVRSDGSFVVETTTLPTGTQKMDLRQKLAEQTSPKIQVANVDVVAELPRVEVTSATSFTDASGQAVHRYEGTGVAGATVQYGVTGTDLTDGATVGTDGRFVIQTTTAPTGEQKMQLRQTLGEQTSPTIEVAASDVTTGLPRLSGTRATSYTNAAGQTVYRFEGTGIPGATIRDAQDGTGWRVTETRVGEDGRFVHETTNMTPTAENPAWLSQTLSGQNSNEVKVYAADITAQVPRVAVTKATSYLNAAGQTVYRYEGTGITGAIVHYGLSNATYRAGMTIGDDRRFVVETTTIPTGDLKMDIMQKLAGVNSPKVQVPIFDVIAEMPSVSELKATSWAAQDGSIRHRYEGEGVVGASIQFQWKGSAWADGGTVGRDGRFAFETRWTATEADGLRIRQVLGGQTSAAVTAPLPVREVVSLPFKLDTPRVGDTFTPGTSTLFEGTGTAGSTVRLIPQRGLQPAEATVDPTGHWSIRKGLGNGTYVFDIVQTSPAGAAQGKVEAFVFTPTSSDVDRPFAMISPRVGDAFTPQTSVNFVGQGTPGATITLAPQAGLKVETTTVGTDGFWTIRRGMGNGTYVFSVTQTVDGRVEGTPITGFTLAPTR
jgi:hypothetical protein